MTRSYYPTEDTFLNASRGLLKGCEVRNIFGYNVNVALEFVPCWEIEGGYVYPTANTPMSIVSSNTSDTAVTVRIVGLDSNYNEISENVSLNGTTIVPTTKSFFRVNDVITISGNALGDITLSNNATTYAKIRAGEGKNQASIFTVPAGYDYFLYRIDGFSATALSNKYVIFRNYTKTSAGTVLRVAESTFTNQMNIQRRFPFKYTEKTDIQFQAKSSSQTNEVALFGEGLLIKTGLL